MICSHCETPVADGSRFCVSCGADLSDPHARRRDLELDTDTAVQLARILDGRYVIRGVLGQGGMGTVYLAEDCALDRKVAIKTLRAGLAVDDDFVRRFEQEARTAAKLDHPGITPIHAVESVGHLHYFVMKWIDGRSLDEILASGQPLSVEECQRIVLGVAEALSHAHERGVVHRDVKPSNVMIDSSANVVLTDFSIAKALEGASAITATGQLVGTPHYMSPEQAQGLPVDGRSDQYSLAVLAYRMLTGHLPFEGENARALIFKQITEPATPVDSMRRDVPPAFAGAIARALAKDASDRFDSMQHFAAAVTGERPVDYETPVPGPVFGQGSLDRPDRTVRLRTIPTIRRWQIAGASVIVGVVGVWGFLATRSNDASPVSEDDLDAAVASVAANANVTNPVSDLEIVPIEGHLTPGASLQLLLSAWDAAGDSLGASGETWMSSAPSIASVTTDGLVTANRPGRTIVSAQVDSVIATATIFVADESSGSISAPTVSPPTAVRITPDSVVLEERRSAQLTGSVMRADGSSGRAEQLNWSVGDDRIARVSQDGIVVGLVEGVTSVVGSVGSFSDTVTIRVDAIPVATVTIAPIQGSVGVGGTLQLSATPRDRLGEVLSGRSVMWDSSDPRVARVTAAGLVTGVSPGQVVVSASSGSVSATVPITVATVIPDISESLTDSLVTSGISEAIATYRSAIEREDLSAIRAIYPNLAADQEAGWRDFFAAVSDLTYRLTIVELEVTGPTAEATLEGVLEFTLDDVSQSRVNTVTALLTQGPRGWRISSIQ